MNFIKSISSMTWFQIFLLQMSFLCVCVEISRIEGSKGKNCYISNGTSLENSMCILLHNIAFNRIRIHTSTPTHYLLLTTIILLYYSNFLLFMVCYTTSVFVGHNMLNKAMTIAALIYIYIGFCHVNPSISPKNAEFCKI